MLKGNKVRLRAVEPEDLDLMYLIENDTELWSCGHNTVPFSYYALKQYLSENTNDLYRDRQLRFVIETTEGIGVGFLDLMHFDPLLYHAEKLPDQRGGKPDLHELFLVSQDGGYL